MKEQQFIECCKGNNMSTLKLSNNMFDRVVGLLRQNNYLVKIDGQCDKDLKRAKGFLCRVTSFMMTAFMQYLKQHEQYIQIFECLLNIKQNKRSKQQKLELMDLRNLTENQTNRDLFLEAFEQFLNSPYLVDYIQNNTKVYSKLYKKLYLWTRVLFLEEINKGDRLFTRFISNINAQKMADYWREMEEEFKVQNSKPQVNESLEVEPSEEKYTQNSDSEDQFNYSQFESQFFISKD